jgi:endoglucanase
VALLAGCAFLPGAKPSARGLSDDERAVRAAAQFLQRYVEPDGRVVRRDQGGDTVSEGQGYALLLAVATGDKARFGRVWSWTQQHLARPDGLLGYHWQGGRVVDPTPAADADVQTAWALTLAGERFRQARWTADARRLAASVLTAEVGYDDQGQITLAAGPWARAAGRPLTTEPGYWTPPAYAALAGLSGDGRWDGLSSSDLAHLRVLTHAGTTLAPDWALLSHGPARPTTSPDGQVTPQQGPDGMRATIWATCTPDGRKDVARSWPTLARTANQAPLSRTLDGAIRNPNRVPLSAVAAAAAAQAAGQHVLSRTLLATADDLSARYPSYYGDAWTALGRLLLTTDRLATCGGPADG